jgi:prepilin-type N-terminal cleavage/methylation domain-containing protein
VLKYFLKNKAFSLLELIISVAVLSIGIVIVLEAFSFSGRSTGLFCSFLKAVFLAEDNMQDLERIEKQKLLKEEESAPIKLPENYPDTEFTGKYDLKLDPDLKLYRLDLWITWKRLNREEKLEINTYLRQ